VGTILKYHTVGAIQKYHTVGAILKYHNTTAMYEEKALYRLQLSGRYKYFNYVLFVLRHNSKIRNNHVCY
jgi:hypothetical protein